MSRITAILAPVLLLSVSSARAHYLWVTIDRPAGEHGAMNLYFEGGPSAGDGQHLDPFVDHGQTWLRTVDQEKPIALEMAEVNKDEKRWLTSKLPSPAPRVIESYGKWGVYRYGTTDVLLHYYAKNFDITAVDQLGKLASSSNLKLDMRPSWSGKTLQLQVFWQGKPATNCSVSVRGPKGFQANLKTDEKGVANFEPNGSGRYTLRTSIQEKKSGSDAGKEYQQVRHHATMLTTLPKNID